MANIFRKVKKKIVGNNSSQNGTNSKKKVNHDFEYTDPLANINFQSSSQSFFTPTHGNAAELTIFWTQPRTTRERKDNPIYVNEPVDFYEDFIPAENVHDLYRVRDRRSWVEPGVMNTTTHEVPRSKSLSYIPNITYDKEIQRRPEPPKRLDTFQNNNLSGVEKLTSLFTPPPNLRTNLDMARDSGIGPDVNDEQIIPLHQDDVEEEPIEVLLARKLSEFEPNLKYDDHNIAPLNASNHSFLPHATFSEEEGKESKDSISYWASSESLDNNTDNDDLSFSQVEERKLLRSQLDNNDDVFNVGMPQQKNLTRDVCDDDQHMEVVSWSSVDILEEQEQSFHSDIVTDDNNPLLDHDLFAYDTCEETGRRLTWPRGSFIKPGKSTSLDDIPKYTHSGKNGASSGLVSPKFKTDDLFFNMEKTLHDLEFQLNEVLETNPIDNIPMQSHNNKNDRIHEARIESVKNFLLAPPETTLGTRSRSWSLNALTSKTEAEVLSPVLRIPKKPCLEDLEDHINAVNVNSVEALPSPVLDGQIDVLEEEKQAALYSIKFSTSVKHSKNDIIPKKDGTFDIAPVSNISHSEDESKSNLATTTHSFKDTLKLNLQPSTVNTFQNSIQTLNKDLSDNESTDNNISTSRSPVLPKSMSFSVNSSARANNSSVNLFAPKPYKPTARSHSTKLKTATVDSDSQKTPSFDNWNINLDHENVVSSVENNMEAVPNSFDDLPSFTIDLNKEPVDSEDCDTSYLNVDGPVNSRTSSGVSLLRRGSSVYHVRNKKKKSYIDELMEGCEPERVYPDRACKRTIMSLMVRCYNFGNDCEWTGELGSLQDHIEQCQLVPVDCVNACGRSDIPRNQMNQHIDSDGDCPLAVVACRYSDVGCKFKCRRLDMVQHIQETIEQHLDLAHTRIRELEVRQENICMNGKFLWKISNYDHLMKQSATKKDKEKLCSPPFYTGQYGYKLRAEAFLNGLGQGKGSHLSLYVVIMKGEYDAILPWPFKQNVDFFLMDQDDDISNRQNKVWKLSCERNSDYFKRPTKSKSLGFGCPKFVSLETLATRNYIRDQTIFIKIVVEPTDGLIFNPSVTTH
ncbi:uncharacterized protein LOC130635558 [Hydractinia symbiolongicarpus]|uniref:uncharacterized protein LOC130635558 n=1 Tax=Hydractinia symbiolongicarpus TaxID=13093 RepID=UPI00254C92EE|nr:uncharacterized protein LOC130635558 [Hydractinia symbiolongicarpus]